MNAHKHGAVLNGVDTYSSGATFDGWRDMGTYRTRASRWARPRRGGPENVAARARVAQTWIDCIRGAHQLVNGAIPTFRSRATVWWQRQIDYETRELSVQARRTAARVGFAPW